MSAPDPRPNDARQSAKRWRAWLLRLVGPAILVAILASLDLDRLREAFARADLWSIALAYPLLWPTVFLRTWRWTLLMDPAGPRASYTSRLVAYAYALFIGVATPGRLGEFVKIVHLTREGTPFGRAFSSVLLDRLFDVGLLVVVAAAGSFIVALPDGGSRLAAPVVALSLVVGVALAVLVTRPGLSARISAVLAGLSPARHREALARVLDDFFAALRMLRASSLMIASLITIVCWLLTYLGNYLLSRSLGLTLSFAEICGISAVCSLVTLVPISIMGAGTRDAMLVLILARYGYDSAHAVALSTLFLTLPLSLGLLSGASVLHPAAHLDRNEAERAREHALGGG